uniref:Protein kinase domain-containing protein n=1 Tax=Peronospora matthiolae TaxID=2874970 RepID=A0AAV1UUN1_9STRA
MPLSTSRRGPSPDPIRGDFFHLCGSPIRTHTRKSAMDLDDIHGISSKRLLPSSSTFVRPAETVDLPRLPSPVPKMMMMKKKKSEGEPLGSSLDVEGHAYYYHNRSLYGVVPSSSITPFASYASRISLVTITDSNDSSRRLDSARRAGVPLCLSDWFDPIKHEDDERCRQTNALINTTTMKSRDEPESECTVRSLQDEQQSDEAEDAMDDRFLEPQQNVDMADVTIGRVIGEGAFGKVFQASWKGRNVAMKVLVRQNLTADVVREFETEVKIMSGLHHPNICSLLGACLAPESRALVIELVEHGSLWAVLRTRRRQLSEAMRTRFVVDTARGMRYLHQFELPILHRDMKSPNLLVERNFSIKISDFGLSRVKAQIQTMTGNCGTVQWMAPEVLGNCKYTEKADVFSFGIVVWEIFTGQCPYDGMTQIQVALGVLNHDLRPVIPRSCPRFFARLIQSCWAREPSLRPSFSDIMHTFEQHVAYH